MPAAEYEQERPSRAIFNELLRLLSEFAEPLYKEYEDLRYLLPNADTIVWAVGFDYYAHYSRSSLAYKRALFHAFVKRLSDRTLGLTAKAESVMSADSFVIVVTEIWNPEQF